MEDDVQRLVAVIEARAAGAEKQMAAFVRSSEKRLKQVEDAARKSAANMDRAMASGADRMGSSISGFARRASGLLAAAFSAREVIRAADAWTEWQNRVQASGVEASALAGVMERLQKISSESRAALSATVDLYSRMNVATSELGLSQEDLFRVVSTVQKSLALSGATTAEASSVVVQLGQAMSEGILRGEEFNAINSAAPGIMRAIAKELGITKSELRKFAEEGKISVDIVIRALLGMQEATDEAFEGSATTVSQATQQMSDSLTALIGKISETTGAAEGLASAFRLIGSAAAEMTKYIDTVSNIGVITLDTIDGRIADLRKQLEQPVMSDTWGAIIGSQTHMNDGARRDLEERLDDLIKYKEQLEYINWLMLRDSVDLNITGDPPPPPPDREREDLGALRTTMKAANDAAEAYRKLAHERANWRNDPSAVGEMREGMNDISDRVTESTVDADIAKLDEAFQKAYAVSESFRGDFVNAFVMAIEDGDVMGALESLSASFARRMYEDLANSLYDAIQEALSGSGGGSGGLWSSIANIVGAALGGGSSATAPGGMYAGRGWASGGYTGAGGKYDVAGAVHKGEYVMDADATRRIGVGALSRLQHGGSLSGRGNMTFAPVINAQGAGPNEIARLEQIIARQQREFMAWAGGEENRSIGYQRSANVRRRV